MVVDPAVYRLVAGSFASGVTVITSGKYGAFRGMTARAFTSLSLDPPMVLVCVDRATRTLSVIQSAGVFNVNILGDHQEETSRRFATKSEAEPDGMRGYDYTLGRLGAPILKDALAHFECRLARQFDGGDHLIFVGAVEAGATSGVAMPLLYFRGQYRQLAKPDETT
jgi:3-hydroxy-9,10-secoandrosta-1,3,5(10)-triene-9,17-dione monooxygenase reductase component